MQDRTKEVPMRKVIANLFASLDGFAVDRDGEMRWVTDDYGRKRKSSSKTPTTRWTSCCWDV